MPTKPNTTHETDRKINLIPNLMNEVARLNQLIVTGNLEQGEPGLLEDVRNIRKDIKDIKASQSGIDVLRNRVSDLERRIIEIEERHTNLDKQKVSKKEKIDKITVALTIFAITQIVEMVLSWFHLI